MAVNGGIKTTVSVIMCVIAIAGIFWGMAFGLAKADTKISANTKEITKHDVIIEKHDERIHLMETHFTKQTVDNEYIKRDLGKALKILENINA